MADAAAKPPDQLAASIGHSFSSDEHLSRALTHSSYGPNHGRSKPRNFERLEFLGDRVLGLVIAELLFERFPETDEGGLAKRLNALVRKETCAHVAEKIDLGAYLLMSPGEVEAGGRAKMAILGNACEALIGALYLDGGLEVARRFVETNWVKLIDDVENAPQDAKTALQEWAQARGIEPPTYKVKRREGPDHAPVFTMTVALKDKDPADGSGTSKRHAEQAAAETMLRRLGVWQND